MFIFNIHQNITEQIYDETFGAIAAQSIAALLVADSIPAQNKSLYGL